MAPGEGMSGLGSPGGTWTPLTYFNDAAQLVEKQLVVSPSIQPLLYVAV